MAKRTILMHKVRDTDHRTVFAPTTKNGEAVTNIYVNRHWAKGVTKIKLVIEALDGPDTPSLDEGRTPASEGRSVETRPRRPQKNPFPGL